MGLIDVWRELNPTAKDYTHFSAPHNTYARIDHIFLPNSDIHTASHASIQEVPWSDHSLVTLKISCSLSPSGPPQWRLSKSLLSNPVHCIILEKEIRVFFHLNDIGDISPSVLWGAHKAVLRGKMIQLASQLKKERKADILQMEREFHSLSKSHKANPSSTTLTKLEASRVALNLALTSNADKHLTWLSGRFYIQANKIAPQLAAKLSPKIKTSLPKIRSQSGTLTQNPQKILETFQAFYSKLYSAPDPDNSDSIDSFLNSLDIPTLSDSHRSIMESLFRVEEIHEVIKNLKTESAPGPNGFSAHYYKAFSDALSPYLARLFNSLRAGSSLEPSANLAYISVIPKQGKDPSDVCNYRPISLINNDLKIMMKILANRLASFIANYIHKDQVGFIPGRQRPDQIRRAVDLISLMQSSWDGGPSQPGYVLSIDLQKAFDTVTWPYLFTVLRKWGFGPDFITTISSLYSSPKACIKIQGHLSEEFSILQGTRQGCPLSPILFAIAIETLALAIRQNPDIHGVQCGQKTHKCALFADDVLLFVTSPPNFHPQHSTTT